MWAVARKQAMDEPILRCIVFRLIKARYHGMPCQFNLDTAGFQISR